MEIPLDRRPIVISGPSGVGKGTLCQKLCNAHPDTFAMTTSHTTRKPRTNEIDGVTYFFVSPSTFSSLVSQDGFVEHTFFSGNFYGTSQQTVAEQTEEGLTVVLEVEMNGVKQMKTNGSIDVRYIFIKPPSLEILEARLRDRGTESEENIQRRLAQAQVELDYADLPGAYDKIVINDDLEKAYEELYGFIFASSLQAALGDDVGSG